MLLVAPTRTAFHIFTLLTSAPSEPPLLDFQGSPNSPTSSLFTLVCHLLLPNDKSSPKAGPIKYDTLFLMTKIMPLF